MGEAGGLPFDAALLGAGQAVVDLVYQPVRTPLLHAAATAGCRVVDGLGMLLHQAAIAFEHWTGEAAPLPAMRSALAAAVAE
jgi:shikimate dehydrogenase